MSSTAKEVLRKVYAALDRKPMVLSKIEESMMLMRSSTGREALQTSIFPDALMPEAKAAWQELVRSDVCADRAVGCLVGLALGDAVGHPLEFVPADGRVSTKEKPWRLKKNQRDAEGRWSYMEYLENGDIKYHEEYNKFQLSPGQWTDDCSMALCLADSLLVYPNYHGGDCRTRYHYWWHHGYNNAFRFDPSKMRTSCGLGGNIAKSLDELSHFAGKPVDQVPEVFAGTGEDAGNGSIMRLGGVPIRFWKDFRNGYRVATHQSRATHPGNDAAACCAFMTFFISSAIQRPPATGPENVQDFLEEMIRQFLANPPSSDSGIEKVKLLLTCAPPGATEACWNWRAPELAIAATLAARGRKYNGYPVDEGYFGAYCMDGLAMSLWSLWHSHDFASCTYNVVNLMGDADTTGAICGQMAGAFYGYTAMATQKWSSKMIDNLSKWDPHFQIPLRAVLLYLTEEFTTAPSEPAVEK
jgi:ADP-ribosylglycohydrolase